MLYLHNRKRLLKVTKEENGLFLLTLGNSHKGSIKYIKEHPKEKQIINIIDICQGLDHQT